MLDFLTAGLGLLGGLFGGGSQTQNENFTRHSQTGTEASAQDLSPELLAALEGLFTNMLGGGGFEQSGDAMSSRLSQVMGQADAPQFDVDSFVKGIVGQAVSGAQMQQEGQINDLMTQTGGSRMGNSMNALLANRIENDTAANLGGIASQATATGEGIRQSQQQQLTDSILGLSGGLASQILGLIQATRGASTTGRSFTEEETHGTSRISAKKPLNFGNLLGSFTQARSAA